MGKTKFQTSWKKDRPWLVPVKDDVYSAKCVPCDKVLAVHSGVGSIKQHEITPSHVSKTKVMAPSQAKFSTIGDSFMSSSKKGKMNLTSEQQKWNAEILRALNVVEKNHSFRSCDADNHLYPRMFPDSGIAKNYSQSKMKVKYVIEYGIAPHIQELIKVELCNRPFTFHFDETTTSQVKKQYDGYVTYFSTTKKEVCTTYCGALFVGRCTADDMVLHFYEFMKKAGLDPTLMLSLGMDGPNVNLSFQNKLLKELTIVTLGTCPLHRASTGFGKAILSIKASVVDLDEMATDLHFFFKYSAARREQYKNCDDITGVVAKHLERHCETRWLSLEKVLVKINEQWENLKEYFLKKLPTLTGFKGKNGVESTARYTRIKNYLTNKNIPAIMGFVVFLAQDFKKFIKSLETNEPMIHLLHLKCMQLLRNLFDKFLKSEVFMKKTKENSYVLKSLHDIVDIEVQDVKHHKVSCDFGSRTEKMLQNLDDQLEKKKLKNNMKNALVDSSLYLIKNLPISEQVVYDAQFLCHQKRCSNDSQNAVKPIKRLSYNIANALGLDALRKEFKLKEDDTEDNLVDMISEEFKLYQLEEIPTSFIKAKPEVKTRRTERRSYWKYAYGLVDVELPDKEETSNFVRIDQYWQNVSSMCDNEGKPKYSKLCTMVNCVLTLSHGNADPERGFSITKHQLDLHGNATDESTLESLRIVKDFLMRNGGIENFNVTPELIRKCENAHSQYESHLAEMRKQEQMHLEMKAAEKEDEEKIGKISQLERDIGLLNNGLKMAENIIKEGNDEMNLLLRQKVLNRDALATANSKVTAGCKRKEELSSELVTLEKKKKKLM